MVGGTEAYRSEPSQENLDFDRRGFPDAYVASATVRTADPIPVYEDGKGQNCGRTIKGPSGGTRNSCFSASGHSASQCAMDLTASLGGSGRTSF